MNHIRNPKDPGSAITHFIGIVFSLIFSVPLLLKVSERVDSKNLGAMVVFTTSTILLYTASTVYHTFNLSDKANKRLKKFDHIMIFILIAGTYTPICIIGLNQPMGTTLLILIWAIAIIGIIFKAFWVTCPKWLSSIIYIGMGWLSLLAFSPLKDAISLKGLYWLIGGGVIYTIGGVIYALKLTLFNKRYPNFGSHEIFHLFVMGGSFCHFVLMYEYIAILS